MKNSLGRFVYGVSVIACGICALVWRHIDALASLPHRQIFVCIAAITLILGGAAVLWTRTARRGAVAVGAIYFIFALLGLPIILKQPLVYNGYGNVCEQLSLAAGAMLLYGCASPGASSRLAKIGYCIFGICVISFALEQLFYLSATAGFVPKWVPPGQMFWAIATTAAFALAALALLTDVQARLAARLTAAMVLGFLLLTWLPALMASPHNPGNWSEATETLAIAATAWIVADFLSPRSQGRVQ